MEKRRMARRRLLLAGQAAAAVLLSLLVFCTDHGSNGGNLPAYTAGREVSCGKNSRYGTELRVRDSCGDPGAAHAVHALVRSNTLNLSSMLTAKRFRASVTDLDQLPTNGDYIGYQTAGSVCPFMTNKGIKEDIVNLYDNQTEYFKAMSKGSMNGGGSRTVDEIPYLSFSRPDEQCKAYEVVIGIPYKCPGLDFVFPDKTSPIVQDDVSVDAMILMNIAEGYEGSLTVEYMAIETKWVEVWPLPLNQVTNFLLTKVPNDYIAFGPVRLVKYQLISAEKEQQQSLGFQFTLCQPNRTFGLARDTYVDFTEPYTQSGVSWMFLRPLTKELWLTCVCFVFFTGFVVWMIERPINPVFQGSILTQFGTALYLAFSTLTFSHGQILNRSPLSKIVLLVWCFAVLVLVQSYITNLSSMLAAEASTDPGSSAAGSAPLALRSFSGLFVVVGCISTFMLLISFARSVYAKYTRAARGYESQSVYADGGSVRSEGFIGTPQANGSVPDQHGSRGSSGDEEAGPIEDSISNSSAEPVAQVSVQIEMTPTGNAVSSAL